MILAFGLSFSAGLHAEGEKTLQDLLRGRHAGVRVSSYDGSSEGALNVHVRGVNSIRSSAQPLYVLDGTYINTSLDETLNSFWRNGEGFRMSSLNPLLFINVDDIESVEVLSNISATALYGSEGANGVVLITTRNAQRDRLDIDWNSSVSLVTPAVSSEHFGVSVSHDHRLSVGMSKGGVRYYLSGYWRDQRGAVAPSRSQIGGLRLNFETSANKYINFGLNAAISLGDISSVSGPSWAGTPSYSLSTIDSSLYPDDTPEGWLRDHDDDSKERRALASAWIKINFLKSLFWKTTFGVDYQSNTRYVWYGRGTSYGLSRNGAATILNNNILRYRLNSALSFSRYFSTHHFGIDLGFEADGLWLKSNTMNGSDFFNHDLRAKGLSLGAAKAKIFEIDNNHDRQAAFVTISYDWNGIVGADGIFRAEVLRKFHDWAPSLYPSGEVWADLHKAIMPEFKPVSSLRLSAGYGIAGYDRSMPYETMHKWVPQGLLTVDENVMNWFKGLNTLTTTEIHAGIKAGLLSDRIVLGVTWYDRRTEDNLAFYSFGKLKDSYWQKSSRKEVLSRSSLIANKGLEFELSGVIFNSKDVSWRMDANLSYNVNQLYDVHGDDVVGVGINADMVANRNILGMQAGALYGYEYRNGAFADRTGDGRITQNDKVIIGSPIPAFIGGLNSVFRYRDFMFTCGLDGAAGHHILNLSRMYTDADPMDVISDKYVEKGDFLRLSEVSFSYDVPFNVKWIQSLKVSLTGRNLYTFTGYSGRNPDVDVYGAVPMAAGMDYGSWPMTRSVMLGLSVEF